jgi:hypothetical protein
MLCFTSKASYLCSPKLAKQSREGASTNTTSGNIKVKKDQQ